MIEGEACKVSQFYLVERGYEHLRKIYLCWNYSIFLGTGLRGEGMRDPVTWIRPDRSIDVVDRGQVV